MKPAVRERLEKLSADSGGTGLSIFAIITDAKSAKSPLHAEFEWDKAKAHDVYLRMRAQQLIRDWYVEQQTGKEETVRVRRMVSLGVEDDLQGSRRYFPIEQVLEDPAKLASMLGDALRELQTFRKKYRNLSALAEVFSAIEKLEEVGQQQEAA